MGKRISDRTKQARGYGRGEGADYKPAIRTEEFNSLGTCSVVVDWKTGRGVHCMSQGEAMKYRILRWDDGNADVREQFPLPPDEIRAIAEACGLTPPRHVLTTDFVTTRTDGSLRAYSVKAGRSIPDPMLRTLFLEKSYWTGRGVPFTMVYKPEIDQTLATNIRLACEFYDERYVRDDVDMIKHLIAVKELPMPDELLTVPVLRRVYAEWLKEVLA